MIRKQNLLVIRGCKFCVLSSNQIVWHKVTSWCPVALIRVAAGSLLKWSETKSQKLGMLMERPKNNHHLTHYIPLSNGSFKNSRLRSRLSLATGTGALPARGLRHRATIARRRLLWLRVSASNEVSPSPEQTQAASTGTVRIPKIHHHPKLYHMQFKHCHKLDSKSMEGLCAALGTSSQYVTLSTSNSIPDPPGTMLLRCPGQTVGSRKTRTLNQKSPIIPPFCISTRCKLVYGNQGETLY